jgi:hypothetical protein
LTVPFEEFVILEDRMSAEERRQFLARIRELRHTPPPGLCLLFSFRRDYMSDVIAMKIDDLVPSQSFREIDSFRRDAARLFLERAPDAPVPALVNSLSPTRRSCTGCSSPRSTRRARSSKRARPTVRATLT